MKIPYQKASKLNEIFTKGELFGAIDSNLESWLQQDWKETEEIKIETIELEKHQNNEELINCLGGSHEILNKTLQPQHIKYLAENDHLQTNGLSNLFFVYSEKLKKLFIVGVVWDKPIERFVPYIYRTRNLYRAWTKGNKVFIKK